MKRRKIRIVLAATALVSFAGPSGAVFMSFTHSLREFVDRGNVTIKIYSAARPS